MRANSFPSRTQAIGDARCRVTGSGRNESGDRELPHVRIYVWILLITAAGVLVVYFAVIVAWMLVLRRVAQSGIRSWDELEPEDAEIHPFS
jgi:hypothetical protein